MTPAVRIDEIAVEAEWSHLFMEEVSRIFEIFQRLYPVLSNN